MFIPDKTSKFFRRVISTFIVITFITSVILPPSVSAQVVLNLPAPGVMVTPTAGFTPALINGITIHPENPLEFDFIVGSGDEKLEGKAFEKESIRLIKYFMAALTVPEDEMWVNLSPVEKDRIIPQGFGTTEMGRDLLAQDYILKQLTASLMYPEKELGQKFWDKIYKKAKEQFGITEIPVDTFNKVWIIPEKAVVYEHENSAFVVKSHLKVMLEQDYVALQHASKMEDGREKMENRNGKSENQFSLLDSQPSIIKEIIVPAIEKEVNEGQTFAQLRQIYNSVILAAWFKQNLKQSLLGQVYVDKTKTKGIETDDKEINQKIYNQYLEAFKKGVYNYIKEDYDSTTQEVIPRKYFSGGTHLAASPILEEREKNELTPGQREEIDGYIAQQMGSDFAKFNINMVEFGSNVSKEELAGVVREAEAILSAAARETAASPVKEYNPVEKDKIQKWIEKNNRIIRSSVFRIILAQYPSYDFRETGDAINRRQTAIENLLKEIVGLEQTELSFDAFMFASLARATRHVMSGTEGIPDFSNTSSLKQELKRYVQMLETEKQRGALDLRLFQNYSHKKIAETFESSEVNNGKLVTVEAVRGLLRRAKENILVTAARSSSSVKMGMDIDKASEIVNILNRLIIDKQIKATDIIFFTGPSRNNMKVFKDFSEIFETQVRTEEDVVSEIAFTVGKLLSVASTKKDQFEKILKDHKIFFHVSEVQRWDSRNVSLKGDEESPTQGEVFLLGLTFRSALSSSSVGKIDVAKEIAVLGDSRAMAPERLGVVRRLGGVSLEDPARANAIAELLKSFLSKNESQNIRMAAAYSLGQIGGRSELEEIKEDKSNDEFAFITARRVLAYMDRIGDLSSMDADVLIEPGLAKALVENAFLEKYPQYKDEFSVLINMDKNMGQIRLAQIYYKKGIDVTYDPNSKMIAVSKKQSSSAAGKDVGGINLDPKLLDLQIKRDGNGVPLPLPMQPIKDMHIEGFIPIIINVTPVTNLPLLLGLSDTTVPARTSVESSPGLGPIDKREAALL